ncbi:hypothetical protein ACS0TY_020175 [Phlomoides rotata]
MGDTRPPIPRISSFFCIRYWEVPFTPDSRNMLLVVATLITTVTFQAGVSPPGGVWQDDGGGHMAGRSIYSSQKGPFLAFLLFNTLALSTSIVLLMSLTYNCPFYPHLWAAIAAMYGTYAAAVFAVAPDESVRFRYLFVAAAVPFAIRVFGRIYEWMSGKKPEQVPTNLGDQSHPPLAGFQLNPEQSFIWIGPKP